MTRTLLLRLADALVVFLFLLLPFMLILGHAEGTAGRPTVLFWVLLLLPLLFLPWLWSHRDPVESGDAPRAAVETQDQADTAARLAETIAPVVDVRRRQVIAGVPVLEGRARVDAATAFAKLEHLLKPLGFAPLVESIDQGELRVSALPLAIAHAPERRSSIAINFVLFVATVATTVWAGALHQGVNLLAEPGRFAVGLPYAVALLAILGVHEMGHFVVARWHGVEVTWPYFIPVPMGLGTLGAFIQIKSLIKSRRAVFDIGIAGPLAGLVVALPVLYLGLRDAVPAPGGTMQGIHAGSSVVLTLLYQLAHGGDLASASAAHIRLPPMALAGWIGLVVTALNLLPVGQLDGGHIAYGLFGRKYARAIAIATFVVMLALGVTVWPGLLTWALLIALMAGFSHMPALNDVTPPDAKRFALGALALIVLVLIVAPLPGAMRGMMLDCPYM